MIAVETRNSRSCAEPKAQAEAGPLIPMMRCANMGASIAGEGGNRKGRQGSARPRPGGVSSDGLARADVPGHHAGSADHRAIADGDAGQNDGGPPDPDIVADPHWTAELEPGAPRGGVARVIGGIDLHGRTDLGAVADCHLDDIKDDAIEVEEDAIAEADVEAVVAEERRADHGALADPSQALRQQGVLGGWRLTERGVVSCEPFCAGCEVRLYFGVVGPVQF